MIRLQKEDWRNLEISAQNIINSYINRVNCLANREELNIKLKDLFRAYEMDDKIKIGVVQSPEYPQCIVLVGGNEFSEYFLSHLNILKLIQKKIN